MLDRVSNTISSAISMGFGNGDISVQSTFADELDSAKYLFFDLKFRKSRFFKNFTSKEYFPFGSHRLRLLDLLVFRGNKIQETQPSSGAPGQSEIHAITFHDQKIFLASSTSIGPYVRFSTNDSISDYNARLKLEELVFDFETPRLAERALLPGCLHQLDSGHCLFCAVHHQPSADRTACVECGPDHFRQNSLGLCLETGTEPHVFSLSSLLKTNLTLTSKNVYNLGKVVSIDSNYIDVYILRVFSSIFTVPGFSVFKTQLVPDINDDQVHFLDISFHYDFSNRSQIRHPILNLLFKNASTFMPFTNDFDSGRMGPDASGDESSSLFTLFGADAQSNITFDEVNFLLNSQQSANLFIDNDKTVLQYTGIPVSQFLALLSPTSLEGFTGRLHPMSFPLNYLGNTHLYRGHSLVEYMAQEYQSTDVFDGFFVEDATAQVSLKACSQGCKRCKSLEICDECNDSYFLSHGVCKSCSPDCSTCQNHSLNCLACADGSAPDGTYLLD